MSNILLKIKSCFLLAVFSILLLPLFSTANAQQFGPVGNLKNDNDIAKTLCNAVVILRGTPVKIVAAIMVMAVGAGFLLGKIDIKLVIGVALGVAVVFGAPTIYNAVTGNNSGSCTGNDPAKTSAQ